MVSVRPKDARTFYEEDEDPQKIFAALDSGDGGLTAPPGREEQTGAAKLRHAIAVMLRHLANIIEPSRIATRPRR